MLEQPLLVAQQPVLEEVAAPLQLEAVVEWSWVEPPGVVVESKYLKSKKVIEKANNEQVVVVEVINLIMKSSFCSLNSSQPPHSRIFLLGILFVDNIRCLLEQVVISTSFTFLVGFLFTILIEIFTWTD